MGKRNKELPRFFVPKAGKNLPNLDDRLQHIESKPFRWRILKEYVDFNHNLFGWRELTSDKILNMIIPKLHKFEELNWIEARKRKHFHAWKTSELDKRLKTLAENRGYENLYQIDISDSCRIFGLKSGDTFFCIWYDEAHNGKKMS